MSKERPCCVGVKKDGYTVHAEGCWAHGAIKLKPGWLMRDVKRAAERVKQFNLPPSIED